MTTLACRAGDWLARRAPAELLAVAGVTVGALASAALLITTGA